MILMAKLFLMQNTDVTSIIKETITTNVPTSFIPLTESGLFSNYIK